jgi:hypothetical protein
MKDKIIKSKPIPTVTESINRSRKLPAKMKPEILKYVSISSSRYINGVVYELVKPIAMGTISKKIQGCSLGADKNGFFVHTHRARSKSFPLPLKIDKKSIDFIESTG